MALTKGSRGLQVAQIQDWITKVKLYTGPKDGVFDTRTWEAVLKFQQLHGLKADGIVGSATMAKFTEVLTGKKPDTVPKIPQNLPFAGRLFLVAAGHGGKDPGAVDSVNLAEGDNLDTREDDLVFIYGREFANLLRTNGAEVIEIRTEDSYISPEDKVKLSKKYPDADAYFEFHANAGPSTANGFEALTYSDSGIGYRVAKNVVAEVQKTGILIHGAGVFVRPDLIVLHYTPMPANIFEIGFITNVTEEVKLHDRNYRTKLLLAILRGVQVEFSRNKDPGYNYELIRRGSNEIHLVTIKNPKLGVAASPWGTLRTVADLAKGTGAKLALNGGYFYVNPKTGAVAPVTPVMASGVSVGSKVKKQVAKRAAFCVRQDGTMEIKQVWGPEELAGYKHAIGAGPLIVANSRVKVDTSEKWAPDIMNSRTSRSFLGLVDQNTLVFGVVTKAGFGISLNDLAAFLVERGCKWVMNLDGGGSCTLWPKFSQENRPVANTLLIY